MRARHAFSLVTEAVYQTCSSFYDSSFICRLGRAIEFTKTIDAYLRLLIVSPKRATATKVNTTVSTKLIGVHRSTLVRRANTQTANTQKKTHRTRGPSKTKTRLNKKNTLPLHGGTELGSTPSISLNSIASVKLGKRPKKSSNNAGEPEKKRYRSPYSRGPPH